MDAAQVVMESVFENMGHLMNEQSAINQGKRTAKRSIQTFLMGTTCMSNFEADQKLASHVINGNHQIREDHDSEPDEIMKPEHDKFQTTLQKNKFFHRPIS